MSAADWIETADDSHSLEAVLDEVVRERVDVHPQTLTLADRQKFFHRTGERTLALLGGPHHPQPTPAAPDTAR